MKRTISIIISILAALLVISCGSTPEELFNQGMAYINGEGVPQDLDKGAELLKQAAEKDYVPAFMEVGSYYFKKGDMNEAIKWYELATEKGDKEAAIRLANAYWNGKNVKQDYAKAVNYFERALEINGNCDVMSDAEIHNSLGYLYYVELGTDQDVAKAVPHYEKAIELDESMGDACYALGQIIFNGAGGVKKDYKKMFELFQKGAQYDHADCLFGLMVCYDSGLGVGINKQNAVTYAQRAAKLGQKDAQRYLKTLGIPWK